MASDDGQQRSQIHLRTNEATKKKWENFIDESDTVSSMSELVRHGVTTFIAQEENDGPSNPGQPSETGVDAEYGPEIVSGVREIQTELEDITGQLNTIERSQQRGDELENLAEDVFTVLPEAKPGTEEHDDMIGTADVGPRAWSGTLTDIAKTVLMDGSQRNRERVTHALMRLSRSSSTVKNEEIDGERRHWKEVD